MSFPEDPTECLKRPRDFAIFSGPVRDDPEHWSLGPMILTRDSDLLSQSNADALKGALADAAKKKGPGRVPAEDWQITNCSHWAVGWVEHVSFRALNKDGSPSAAFTFLKNWFDKLDDYPVADEEDFSNREYEATLSNITDAGQRYLIDGAPEGWESDVFSWFWEHDQGAVEPRDGGGGYPDDEKIKAALKALGLLDPEQLEAPESFVYRFERYVEKYPDDPANAQHKAKPLAKKVERLREVFDKDASNAVSYLMPTVNRMRDRETPFPYPEGIVLAADIEKWLNEDESE
jgi:ABC-type glycerol-3-phosphate transport system substrate-binding protein